MRCLAMNNAFFVSQLVQIMFIIVVFPKKSKLNILSPLINVDIIDELEEGLEGLKITKQKQNTDRAKNVLPPKSSSKSEIAVSTSLDTETDNSSNSSEYFRNKFEEGSNYKSYKFYFSNLNLKWSYKDPKKGNNKQKIVYSVIEVLNNQQTPIHWKSSVKKVFTKVQIDGYSLDLLLSGMIIRNFGRVEYNGQFQISMQLQLEVSKTLRETSVNWAYPFQGLHLKQLTCEFENPQILVTLEVSKKFYNRGVLHVDKVTGVKVKCLSPSQLEFDTFVRLGEDDCLKKDDVLNSLQDVLERYSVKKITRVLNFLFIAIKKQRKHYDKNVEKNKHSAELIINLL